MNVICPKCKESYSIKIDLFLDKKQQLQCIRCGHNWEENFFKEAVEKEEKFVECARYLFPTYSNIIEEVGIKIFNYLFLNEDLKSTLESCQATAQKYLK